MSSQASKPINRSKTTQISDITTFDPTNIFFDEPIKTEIDSKTTKMTIYRINMFTKINGKESDLVFEFDRMSMTGIKETRDEKSNDLTGYSTCMFLFDNPPTERQEKTLEVIQAIVDKCKDHILSIKKLIKKNDLERSELKKISFQSFSKDKETDEPKLDTPYMVAKAIYKKSYIDKDGNEKPGKIYTQFYSEDEVDENGNQLLIDPLDYLDKRGFIRPAIKIESIFIGANIKIQAKLYEAEIKIEEQKNGFRRLLSYSSNTDTKINLRPIVSAIQQEEPAEDPIVNETTVQVDNLEISDDEAPKKSKKKISKR